MSDKDRKDHIVATADPDAPEILEDIALDQATGGAQYGSSNSCEPTTPVPTETVSMNYVEIEWTYAKADTPGPGALKKR